jgi:cytoskeletal protein CcmA (bactofilin family)
MLKKENKFEDDKAFVPSEKVEEKKSFSVSSPVARDEKTIIGEHITIQGNIRGEENLVIEGSMKGNIEMEKHNFAVGSKGRFEGEIHAHNVSISGQMIGNIKTQGKVEITKEADFIGEIRAKSILIEDGAYFKGAIELDQEPHRKAVLTEKATTIHTAQPVKDSIIKQEKEASKGN